MKSHLSWIKKIPSVVFAEEVFLSGELKGKIKNKNKIKAAGSAKKNSLYHIFYLSNNHKVEGFIFESNSKKQRGKLPVVIYNHGGSGKCCFLKPQNFFEWDMMSDFVDNGYIVFASQYSGCGNSEGKDEIGGADLDDVLTLKKIIAAYPRADSRRIGMFGESRGGMMVYLSIAKVGWIKGAAVVGAVSNLVKQEKYRPELKDYYRKHFKYDYLERKKRSAVFWPEKLHKNTPLLLIHGGADKSVDVSDSISMSKKLKRLNFPHQLVVFKDDPHELFEDRREDNFLVINWFNAYVKKAWL